MDDETVMNDIHQDCYRDGFAAGKLDGRSGEYGENLDTILEDSLLRHYQLGYDAGYNAGSRRKESAN